MKATQLIEDCLAQFLALAAMNENRLRCQCTRPLAGVFDLMHWTTCQRCGKGLTRDDHLERKQ